MRTRRQVLQGVGIAGVAALAPAQLLTARKSAAVPVAGVNVQAWNVVNAATGGHMAGERFYSGSGVPGGYPHLPGIVRRGVFSFKPNMNDVLSGKLDSQLRALAGKVPAGQAACGWDEGELPHNGFTPSQIQRFHAHVAPIFRAAGAKYVQIAGSYGEKHFGSRVFAEYISGHVDAVYLDGYGRTAGQAPADIFGPAADAVTSAVGKSMPRGITETNSMIASQRADWIRSAGKLAAAGGYEVFLTFWKAGTPIAWLPHDSETIAVMRGQSEGQY
jgi:hypothetical protein